MSWNAIKEKQINNKIFFEIVVVVLAVAVFSKLLWNTDIVRTHKFNKLHIGPRNACDVSAPLCHFNFQRNSDIHAKKKLREIMFHLWIFCKRPWPPEANYYYYYYCVVWTIVLSSEFVLHKDECNYQKLRWSLPLYFFRFLHPIAIICYCIILEHWTFN